MPSSARRGGIGITATLEVFAPTRLEWLATEVVVPGVPIRHCGVGLKKLRGPVSADGVILAGVAGGLVKELKAGTVFVPEAVALPDGPDRTCDPDIVHYLRQAANVLGFESETGRMLTAEKIVTARERGKWAAEGFVAVDMEAALLNSETKIASVRVILDTPEFSIAEDWEQAGRAILRPSLWPELFRLAGSAPRYAFRAARVLKTALDMMSKPEER